MSRAWASPSTASGRAPRIAALARAEKGALEALVRGDRSPVGETFTLADLPLFPMIAYFTGVAEGAEPVRQHPALSRWHAGRAGRARAREAGATASPPPARVRLTDTREKAS